MHSEIKQWGHSAAVRLPKTILAQAGIEVATPIRINVEAGKVIIEAVEKGVKRVQLPFSESELLKGLDERVAHADALSQPRASELGA